MYDEVLGVQDYLKTNKTLYKTKDKWSAMVTEWYSSALLSLDVPAVKKEVNTFMKTVDHLEKSKMLVLRLDDVLTIKAKRALQLVSAQSVVGYV